MQSLQQAFIKKGIVTPEEVERVEKEIKDEENRQRKLRRESRAKAILQNDPNVPKILEAQKVVQKAIAKYEALIKATPAYQLEDIGTHWEQVWVWTRKDLDFLQYEDNVPPGASFPHY